MKPLLPALLFLLAPALAAAADSPATVTLNWLDHSAPLAREGVSWGVPWPQGKIQKNTALSLHAADGQAIPVQSWPLAYWPDGSIKWSGLAVSAGPETAGPLQLSIGASTAPSNPIKVTETDQQIEIVSGPNRCVIPKSGAALFSALFVGERKVAQDAKLVLQLEDRSQLASDGITKRVDFTSKIEKVTLEQSGPVRAVVKIEGEHFSDKANRALLPFVVRLYFYSGNEPMRIVHSFVYNGDPHKDFIKGLGITFSVPFAEEIQNRHMRFAGDGTGVWEQPALLLPGYRQRVTAQIYQDQLAGRRTPNLAEYDANTQSAITTCPIWNDTRLTQLGPNSFAIAKRTTDNASWLHVTDGRRALGLAVLGDCSGGIAVGLKNFWQRYPSSLEMNHATTAAGQLTAWFWSPDSDAMDLRVYDEELTYTNATELSVNYEDWKLGWGTAYGIASTHELTLWPFAAMPSDDETLAMAKTNAAPPMLVCAPQYYHDVQVFGAWSLPDKSDPVKKWVEDTVAGYIKFDHDQIEERQWYGFWDYGDVMHNYDPGRHDWRYDIGGWAWTNDELAPDMLLWTQFLRTGDPEIYRMAENMTRQNSEVDVYHLGVFYPLGSRHSVNHWGDGAKQPRISESGFKRYLYFLTTDERTGDLMHEQLSADIAYTYIRYIDPRSGRAANQPMTGDGKLDVAFTGDAWKASHGGTLNPPNDRFGLDWTCYAINWETEYERTLDPKARDYVLKLMSNVAPATATDGLRWGGSYFDIIFGGMEIMEELKPMFPDQNFWNAWAYSCAAIGPGISGGDMTGPRLTAYAASIWRDQGYGVRAWNQLLGTGGIPTIAAPPLNSGTNVVNPVHDPVFLGSSAGWQLHNPATVQWCLNALETLALAGYALPEWEAAHGVGPAK